MKTILISDIKGKHESIIPYGLNFAKYSNNRVNLIHVVDHRKHEAVSSAYADSQTFEVGEKLSPKTIINREVKKAKTELDTILSHEASRLNYPLRIAVNITENSLEKQLKQFRKQKQELLIITSKEPDGTVIDSLEEFFQLTDSFKNYSLIVPPGLKFEKPAKAFVLYDFNTKEDQNIFSLIYFLSNYGLSVDVSDICLKKDYFELEMKSGLWKQVAINHNRSQNIKISTNILQGDNYIQTMVNYIKRNNFDLVVVSRQNPNLKNTSIFSKSGIKRLIDELSLPVLLY